MKNPRTYTEEEHENIRQLVATADTQNLALAYQLIKIDRENRAKYLTELFLIQSHAQTPRERTYARAMLRRFGLEIDNNNYFSHRVYPFSLHPLLIEDDRISMDLFLAFLQNYLPTASYSNLYIRYDALLKVYQGFQQKNAEKTKSWFSNLMQLVYTYSNMNLENQSLDENADFLDVILKKSPKVDYRNIILSNNQFTEIPKKIFEYRRLIKLNLSGNQLQEIPKEIGQLETIYELDLEKNKLTKLPPNLGNLGKLRTLNLGDNCLVKLVDSMGNLKWLTELRLNHNQLKELPKFVENYKWLTILDLRNNQLKSLPEEIGQLENLERLLLANNQLTSLPESIVKLKKLRILDLSGNQIRSLPKGLGQLSQLKTLNLRTNPLGEFPLELALLQNLNSVCFGYQRDGRYLYYGKKMLVSFFKKIKNIKDIELRQKQFKELIEGHYHYHIKN